tara:strand:- start:1470 stop:2120 length:651 start_codon:yes stop_codon:yes gene_type:complete
MMEKSLTINNEDYEKYRPFRKVMVKTNLCYICYKTKNTFERDLDNHDGLYYRYGWLYCEDCENIVNCVEKKYYQQMNHLTYTICEKMIDKEINFWRVSTNKSIQPYLQKNAKIKKYLDNIISYYKKRIFLPVEWYTQQEPFSKKITLANAIYFNEKIFGENIKHFPIKYINKKWKNRIHKEYQICKKIKIKRYIVKKFFENNIQNHIFSFFNYFGV